MHNKLAILVGGGPAPGINSVIGAATIRARLEGIDVIGIRDGFEWLMQGDIDHVIPLTIDAVSRIHFRGGSYLGIARANPTKDPQLLENTVNALLRLNVSQLITIGGDDTAFSAMKLEQHAAGRLRVVHVPKTIDNDLDLPPHVDTFGFQSARHYGVDIVKNLMVDAKTTSRWYFVIAMGRKAGHLALGIGKAAGATVTLISEEFDTPIRLKTIVDTLTGEHHQAARRGAPRRRGGDRRRRRARRSPKTISRICSDVERDAHGHLRLAEVNLGEMLKAKVSGAAAGARHQDDDLGEEHRLRAALRRSRSRSIWSTRATSATARRSTSSSGGNAAMISMQGGHFVPIPFSEMIDAHTGRTKVRMVDIALDALCDRPALHDPAAAGRSGGSARGGAARARRAHLSEEEFRQQFEYLVAHEPPPLAVDEHGERSRNSSNTLTAARGIPEQGAIAEGS